MFKINAKRKIDVCTTQRWRTFFSVDFFEESPAPCGKTYHRIRARDYEQCTQDARCSTKTLRTDISRYYPSRGYFLHQRTGKVYRTLKVANLR